MVAYKETGPIAGAIFAAIDSGYRSRATSHDHSPAHPQLRPWYRQITPAVWLSLAMEARSEAVLVGDKAYITPDKPTLLSLPAGAEVVPDLNDPAFLSRFVDNMYWLTHNKKGEPVQIINNFDTGAIIKSNQEIKAAIYDLGRTIKRSNEDAAFQEYIRRKKQ